MTIIEPIIWIVQDIQWSFFWCLICFDDNRAFSISMSVFYKHREDMNVSLQNMCSTTEKSMVTELFVSPHFSDPLCFVNKFGQIEFSISLHLIEDLLAEFISSYIQARKRNKKCKPFLYQSINVYKWTMMYCSTFWIARSMQCGYFKITGNALMSWGNW